MPATSRFLSPALAGGNPPASSGRRHVGGLLLSALTLTLTVATGLAGCASPPAPPAPPPFKPSQVIPIAQIDRGVLILMPTERVHFDTGKATVTRTEALEFIDRVAALLRDKTRAQVVLEGHTDNQGDRPLNQALSEARAETIRSLLAQRQVDPARLSAQGFAFDRPVAPNDSDAGRQANRRVELIVLGERVENITRGEAPGSFEQAFERLRRQVEQGALARPASPASAATAPPPSPEAR